MTFQRIIAGLLALTIVGLAGAFYLNWKTTTQLRTLKAFVESYVFVEAVAACEKAQSSTPFNWNAATNASVIGLHGVKLDRKTIIEGAWSGFGTAIGSHYTPNDPGYKDLTGTLPYDTAKAKALLAEAGYPNGFSFTIKTPQMAYAPRSAQVMQAMFADIGVTMNIEPTEFPAKWVQDVFSGRNYDMTIVAHAEPLDIDIYSRDPYYFNYKNPDFNELMKKIQLTADPVEQNKLYGEAQTILAEDVPALFLFVMPKLGVWDKKLKGLWESEPIPSNVLTNVSWED